VRAFACFMHRVRPRFAIPFASNSCLLHRDVFHMNSLGQTPAHVREHFERFAEQCALETKLQIMAPGDSWDSRTGFTLRAHDYFENRPARLDEYAANVAGKLNAYYERERRVTVSRETVQKFVSELRRITPGWIRRPLRGEPVLLVVKSDNGDTGFAIDLC